MNQGGVLGGSMGHCIHVFYAPFLKMLKFKRVKCQKGMVRSDSCG